MTLPPLYAIADAATLRARGLGLREFAATLRETGVRLVQLRDKTGSPQEILAAAAILREVMGPDCLLILNDRADLARLAGFHGVHVGQDDLSVADAKLVLGPVGIVGLSTHTPQQLAAADASAADYIAIGPVFATGTKADASDVVGLEGVRRARSLTRKPLVAIGGITLENAASVRAAGADSVAVISALTPAGGDVAEAARDFLRRLR